jgi:hypothetical protein
MLAWLALPAILWITPVVVLLLGSAIASGESTRILRPSPPDIVGVGSRDGVSQQPVVATFTLSPPTPVVISQAGTVSRIFVAPGDVLSSGTELARVDESTIVAFVEEVPLYRDLRAGDTGEDVRALASFLVATGDLDEPQTDGRFGRVIARGVESYQRRHGLTVDGVFRSSHVAFVPQSTIVGAIRTTVGERVQADWTLLVGAPIPLSGTITSASGSSTLPSPSDGATLRIGQQAVPLLDYVLDAAASTDIFEAFNRSPSNSGIGIVEKTSEELSTREFSGAMLDLSRGEKGIVPGTAVYLSPTGKSCLFRSGAAARWSSKGMRVLVVEDPQPAPSEYGRTLVDHEFAGMKVARDPSRLTAETRKQCT